MEEKLLKYIDQNCQNEDFEKNTLDQISEKFQIGRNQCALLLKSLINQKKLTRIEEKPYKYLTTEYLHKKGKSMVETSYSSLETALQKQELHDFEKLVGHEQSLREIVKQCKATIAYPPEGLPLLLYGATGTGKSYIAQLTYEWAKNNNIIKGRFVTVNCSEYANNPELLTANLFGHVKGAFTGADKDNAGLIALTDQGVLFLDEVHELKSECQEKLFLFMDKGIYHRVGDNDKWYKSKVRLIFATTENPENVLLKTLLRRIPMTITIPSMSQRSVQEKIELIYKLFRDEEQRLQCKIKMSNKVYNTLLSSKLAGNIGELKSIIQSCCVNSLFDREGNNLLIHLSSLPSHVLTKLYENPKTLQDTEEYVSVDDLQMFYSHDKEIIQLNDEIIQTYQTYRKERDIGKLVNTGKQIVQNYFDNLIFRKKETPQIEYYKRGVQRIFDMIESRYGIKLTNNDILAIACYLEELNLDYHDFRKWSLQHEEDCEDLNQLLESEFFRAANISLEICTYLKSYLEMEVYPIVVCLFIFYVYNLQSDQRLQQKACVVLAHGFSTASSIANAANHFLGEYIFDAIDMPLHVDTATMVEKLKIYLGRLEKIKELYLLVDMGSLEEIYKGLSLEKMSIGILNNASTPMALEIGNGVRMNIPMEELLKNTISNVKASLMYHIEKNQDKLPLILCSCASGYDTARKLKSTIEDSIPEQCHIEVQIYNYNELLSQGAKASVFEQYNVLCVIGTLDPNIEEIKFI
ncbi:sigma 54-interacting transcriptional regulator, partial [Faecalitalea cylindroides]|uniref:sigma 54-interacting transcriptional regulator n=1 Tax=Faecalitalea cylindroides TaxID=39483 RepID=UPI00189B7C55